MVQNLGHDLVLTTFTSYGSVTSHRQAEIFNHLRKPVGKVTGENLPDNETIQRVLDHLRKTAA